MRLSIKQSLVALLGIALVLPASTASAGLIGPGIQEGAYVRVTVDGQVFEFAPDANGQVEVQSFRVVANGELLAEVSSLGATLDPDPSVAYGLAVVDFGAPSAFVFAFFTPIVPTAAPNTVTGSIVGGLTDFTGDGVSLTPTAATAQVSEVSGPATNMGVDVGGAVAFGAANPGSFYNYGAFASGPIPGPGPGPWTSLSAITAFTLSGGGDIAALTGFASIEPVLVPEPLSLGLLGLGLGVVVYFRRRRA
jgi:hypothetical protein